MIDMTLVGVWAVSLGDPVRAILMMTAVMLDVRVIEV